MSCVLRVSSKVEYSLAYGTANEITEVFDEKALQSGCISLPLNAVLKRLCSWSYSVNVLKVNLALSYILIKQFLPLPL